MSLNSEMYVNQTILLQTKRIKIKCILCYIEILELPSYTSSTLWTIWSISKKLLAITHYGTMSYFLPLYFDIFEALIPSNTSHFPVLSSAYYVIEHIILFNLFTLTQNINHASIVINGWWDTIYIMHLHAIDICDCEPLCQLTTICLSQTFANWLFIGHLVLVFIDFNQCGTELKSSYSTAAAPALATPNKRCVELHICTILQLTEKGQFPRSNTHIPLWYVKLHQINPKPTRLNTHW